MLVLLRPLYIERAESRTSSMADKGGGAERGVGLRFMDKLKAIGDKLENVTSSVASTVKDAAGNIMEDSDLARFKSVNAVSAQLQRKEQLQARKVYSESELSEADRRVDAVITTIHTGHFEPGFDPVKHELEQLSSEAGQVELDALVERLTNGLEVGGGLGERWGPVIL